MKRLVILLLLLIPVMASAQVITQWDKGLVVVKATGYALANKPEAESIAEDAARTEAYGLLLQTVKRVKVSADMTVDQFGKEHSTVETRVEGLVSNVISQSAPTFKQVGDKIAATVEIKMCLHNGGTPECTGQESLQKAISSVVSPAPEEEPQKDSSCEKINTAEFVNRPFDGIASVVFLVDEYQPALYPPFFVVKYPNDTGRFCTVFSWRKLDTPSKDAYNIGGRFKSLFQSTLDASIKMEKQVIVIKGKFTEKGDIMIDSNDGRYIQFIDERLRGELSAKGKAGVVTNSAISVTN